MRRLIPLLFLCLLPATAQSDAVAEPPALSTYVRDPAPWLSLKANSEQRQPVYLGLRPAELVFGNLPPAAPVLRDALRSLSEKQIRSVISYIKQPDIEIEAWPVLEWQGRQTWALARYRKPGDTSWTWLQEHMAKKTLPGDLPPPVLPVRLDPSMPPQWKRIAADFLTLDDLYEKPLFGECVWTQKADARIVDAWLDPDQVATARANPGNYTDKICFAINQPARFNGKPQTFIIKIHGPQVTWPPQIVWQADTAAPTEASPATVQVDTTELSWPSDWPKRYAADIAVLSGQADAVYQHNGNAQRTRFINKNSADAKNQLLQIVDYLESRYQQLGLRTQRESFVWRGIPQANLIAKLPGRHPASSHAPIILADHIDTAFCQDRFSASGNQDRVSAPGADDNMSATAALLQAAQVLSQARFDREIWLYHLTGEEFPADDLGARVATSGWLRRKQAIGGIVLLDMIAYRKKRDPIFQINAGTSRQSQNIAQVAYAISMRNKGPYTPVLRGPFDDRSYLYNTDGLIFSDAGYPVVLFNEHINRLENLDRPHYHQSTDTPSTLDIDYASTIVRSAIQTVAALAQRTP